MSLSRRAFVETLAALAGGCQGAAARSTRTSAHPSGEAFDVVDLSHSLGPESPYLHVRDATFPFRREPIATIPTRGVYANRWELTEHIGTHLDAPCHFDERAPCVDALPLADLFADAVVIRHHLSRSLTQVQRRRWVSCTGLRRRARPPR